MYLVIQQHNTTVVAIACEPHKEITDADEALIGKLVPLLVENRSMEQGYYDLFLLACLPTRKGWHVNDEIDNAILIA